jgi:ABC-type dipeptide/oligopeptide/nickel transport system permease subunit
MKAPGNFTELIQIIIDIINPVLTVLIALAVLVFFKGLVQFIAKSGDEKSHAQGKSLMIWGLIALFVMVSVFGIVRVIYGEFGFREGFGIPLLPVNK